MRTSTHMSIEDRVSALSRTQKNTVRKVEKARATEINSTTDTKMVVLEAIEEGVPVAVLADILKVSVQRIYQIRDEARSLKP